MKHTHFVAILNISIPALLAIAVIFFYPFLWPVLVFVVLSHLPIKAIKQ